MTMQYFKSKQMGNHLEVFVSEPASVWSRDPGDLLIRLLRQRGVRRPDFCRHKFSGAVFRRQARLLVLTVALHDQVKLKEKRNFFWNW